MSTASTPETETIRVVAVQRGSYRDIQRKKGDKFLVVPIKMSTGEILTAREQLSLDRDIDVWNERTKKKEKRHFAGWMKVVGSGPAAQPEAPRLVPQTEALDEKNQKPGPEAGPANTDPEQGSLPDPAAGGSGEDEDERDVI